MTVTDHPNKSGGLGAGDSGPRRRPPAVRGPVAKTDADVADLLGVSAFHPSVLPAAPAPDEGAANDLLDTLVQDHLQRATGPLVTPAPGMGQSGSGGAGSAEMNRADLLQKEIEALLAGEPVAEAPQEMAPLQAAPMDVAPQDEAPREEMPRAKSSGSRPVMGGMIDSPDVEFLRPGPSPAVSDAELSVLLPGSEQDMGMGEEAPVALRGGPVADEPPETMAAMPSAADAVAQELLADASMSARPMPVAERIAPPLDESDGAIEAAEGALAEELAALERESIAAAAAAAAAAPAAEAAAVAEAAGAVDEALAEGLEQELGTRAVEADAVAAGGPLTAPPVVILQPDEVEEEEAAPPGLVKRMGQSVSDVMLMVAQLIDLPFSWINGLDKYIVGVAAVVFFLSGLLLVVVGRWLGAR